MPASGVVEIRAEGEGADHCVETNLKSSEDVDEKFSVGQQKSGRRLLIGCGKCEKSVNRCGKRG